MLVTGSTYEEAEIALMTAKGNLKAAILITQAGVTKETAEHLLERGNGFLRAALESALGLEKAETSCRWHSQCTFIGQANTLKVTEKVMWLTKGPQG